MTRLPFHEDRTCENCAWTFEGENEEDRSNLPLGVYIRKYYCFLRHCPYERLCQRIENRHGIDMEPCANWERQIPGVKRGRDFENYFRKMKEQKSRKIETNPLELKPNIFGIGVDLKKLLAWIKGIFRS